MILLNPTEIDYTIKHKWESIIDFFFNLNPQNPFWILFLIYLRKNKMLEVKLNDDNNTFNTLASIKIEDYKALYNQKDFNDLRSKGIFTKSIIGCFKENDTDYLLFEKLKSPKLNISNINIGNLDSYAIVETANLLINFAEEEWLSANFEQLFDDVVDQIIRSMRKEFSLHTRIQSKELTLLTLKLLEYQEGIIYNPYAKFSEYATEFEFPDKLVSNENNFILNFIGELRYKFLRNNNLVQIEESEHKENFNYNYAITTFTTSINKVSEMSYYFEHIASKANYSVTLIQCPFSSKLKEVYKYIIDNDIVETVINLNKHTHFYDIDYCIIITNNRKKKDGRVKFIDASSFKQKTNTFGYTINYETIFNLYKSKSFSKLSITITTQEIRNNYYFLSASYYLARNIQIPKGYKLTPLENICSFPKYKPATIESGHLLRIIPSKPNANFKTFYSDDFPIIKFNHQNDKFKIDQDCIVIQTHPEGPEILMFSAKKGELYAYKNRSRALIPNQDFTSLPYLAGEMSKDYVRNQYNPFSKQFDSMLGLDRALILVPSLQKQQEDIITYQSNLLGIQEDVIEKYRVNKETEFIKNMHLRKHALAQILNEIDPAIDLIYEHIKSNDTIHNKDIISQRSKLTLLDYIENLKNNSYKIIDLVDHLTDEKTYQNATKINIVEFLSSYKSQKTNESYHIIIDNNLIDSADDNYRISFNPKDLTTVFDNIIANAQRHGFTSKERQDYCIRFTLSNLELEQQPYLSIKIANNGNKLPTGMSQDMVFHWGIGNHTGLGTWQTKDIVEHFGGKIKFSQLENSLDGFYIEYEILLPLVFDINEEQ